MKDALESPAASPTVEDPFAVLGIAPPSTLGDIKRAYFTALQQHPPHADADGFRRLRAAYECLLKPGALETMSWTAGFDRQAAHRALDARLSPRLAAYREECSRAESRRLLRAHFERLVAQTSWAELTALFKEDGALPG